MVNIHNIVAAISPDIYCDPEVRAEVKEIVKKDGYLKAAAKAKVIAPDDLTFDVDKSLKDPLANYGLKVPLQKHALVYDSASEQIEPIYFWLLDYLQAEYKEAHKITDTFVSSPGSGHFAEFGQKRTRMQEEGMKILGTVGQMVKSVLNIVYDLKEFEIRLDLYNNYRDGDDATKRAALLSLKQIWMDTVDFTKRGTTSLKQLAAQYDYVTIIDAFMAAKSTKHVQEELELNERVKNIILQRIHEFFLWIEESEKELRKRYSIERAYLKNQVDTIHMYSRWVAPYLRAAAQLEMSDTTSESLMTDPSLVTVFSTTLMELTLLAVDNYRLEDDIASKLLPKSFEHASERKYHPILIVEMKYRTMPNRVNQRGDYSYGGKVEMVFTAYALNNEELEMLKKTVEDDKFGEVMKLIRGATKDSLDQIQDDINHFLGNKKEAQEEKKKEVDDSNPFSALFGSLFSRKKKKKGEKKDLTKGIEKDSRYEQVFRSQTVLNAREKCYKAYNEYKKAHGMASYPTPYFP